MTLRDLLKTCRYKDIFNIIHQEYYKGKPEDGIYQADCGYRRVFRDLLMLPRLPLDDRDHEYQIYVRERQEGDYNAIDVSLYCNEDEQTYAIDFTPWEDLIDMGIKCSLSLDDTSILAHVLWEITFYGFSAESINEAKEELDEIKKGIDSGETELIPWKIDDETEVE